MSTKTKRTIGTVIFIAINALAILRLAKVFWPRLTDPSPSIWQPGLSGDELVALVFLVLFVTTLVAAFYEPGLQTTLLLLWLIAFVVGVGMIITVDHLDLLGRVFVDQFQLAFGIMWSVVSGLEAFGLWLMTLRTKPSDLRIIERYG